LLQKGVGGFVVASDPFFDSRRTCIIAFAAKNLLPGIYQFRDYAVDGGLISYGPSLTETLNDRPPFSGRSIANGVADMAGPASLPRPVAIVEGFGCPPIATTRRAPGPASESLQ
jgi:hypothetical protein